MANAKFEKVGQTDKPLYGPRKLLLSGFPAGAQPKFQAVLGMVGLTNVPKVWISRDNSDQLIIDLLDLEDETGAGISSSLPRAIIVGGLTENELMQLMAVCRKTGMTNALWATLTPTSEQWTLNQLITELAAERKALQKRK